VRKLPALILAAGLLVSLAACSPPVSTLADCNPVFPSGGNSKAVEVSGTPGSEPDVDFPTPLVAKSGELTVVTEGEGSPIYPGQTIEYVVSQYEPTTGEFTGSSGYETPRRAILGSGPGEGTDPYADMIACTSVGSRVVVTTDVKSALGDSYDPETVANGDDTIVLVFDVMAAYLGKANGWDQLPEAGFPSVVLSPNGRPGITVPGDSAPTDLRVATLKAGTGATVEQDSQVVLHYTGVVWETGTVFDSSWASETGAPVTFSPNDVVAGFAEAMVGAKVGSQVIVLIPPGAEYGYPEGSTPQAVGEGNTMIFVIDILGIEE
jgi:peptidylprolyl isomerase